MFVLTDGSPNKPNSHNDDLTNVDTWVTGANAAIASANTARPRGGGFVVNAVYLSTPTDPGDTNLPFDRPVTRLGPGGHDRDRRRQLLQRQLQLVHR